jgi:hypothetical protein
MITINYGLFANALIDAFTALWKSIKEIYDLASPPYWLGLI